MTPDELTELVTEIRQQQCELQNVEVKAAREGTPRRPLREALSALSNRPGGGVIVFGIDEDNDFDLCGVFDAQRLQEDVGVAAADDMSLLAGMARDGELRREGAGRWTIYRRP